jgi:hypothetical protein
VAVCDPDAGDEFEATTIPMISFQKRPFDRYAEWSLLTRFKSWAPQAPKRAPNLITVQTGLVANISTSIVKPYIFFS